MNEKVCSLLMDLVEQEAIKKFPPDRDNQKHPFNMTHFLKAAGLNSKSNNQKWDRLRKNPANLSVVDIYRLAMAVDLNFLELITTSHILSQEKVFALAAEDKHEYNVQKKRPEKLKKAANHD